MKKILVLGLVILFANSAQAACNYVDKCAQTPYDLSSKATQNVYKYTGMTALSEAIAQSIIKKELKKATKENFKVKVDTYSAKDLVEGRFKSMSIKGKNLEIEGVYLSALNMTTLCNFNYVDISDSKVIKFKENMVMHFDTTITNDDLQKTMASTGYLNMINSVNMTAAGITLFKLEGADVSIKNNKLNFAIKLYAPFSKSITIKVKADLKVEDGQIVLTKLDVPSAFTRFDLSKLTYLLNILNPLDFSLNVIENKDTRMSVQSVQFIDDKLLITGDVFIPKNVK